MKSYLIFIGTCIVLFYTCTNKRDVAENPANRLIGTWQLIQGITITKNDSVVTDYTKNQRMIKIINPSHFAFLKHNVNVSKDSSLNFDAGGGRYTLNGDQYTEHLDFYNDKNWEGKSFSFKISIHNDTLIQKGMEKVEGAGINREIIEKYVKVLN